jgi:hypothetical protein
VTRNSIPTPHGGLIFRSRAEARWAIFFDHLGLKWEYEAQGFNTDGEWYLPDFLIFAPLGNIWAEVKPNWWEDPEGVAKFQRFVTQRPQPSRALLITGVPSIHSRPHIYGGDDTQDNPLKGGWEDDTQEWRPCPSGHHFDLAFPGRFGARFAEDECPDYFGGQGEDRIREACEAALSARFVKRDNGPTGSAA